MKLIFLDVDGVLNCAQSTSRAPHGCIGVDEDKVALLREIVDATDATIILTSTWKQDWSRIPECRAPDGKYLDDMLFREKLVISSKTEDQVVDRGHGIIRFLERVGISRVESWVVLDDDVFYDYEECGILPHLVQTSFGGGGLQRKHVLQAIRYLNGEVMDDA